MEHGQHDPRGQLACIEVAVREDPSSDDWRELLAQLNESVRKSGSQE